MERCRHYRRGRSIPRSCVSECADGLRAPVRVPPPWKAVCSIADRLDVNRETLRLWVRRAETDAGQRPGLTTVERARIRELEREVNELRRANEILKAASAFFSRELDPRVYDTNMFVYGSVKILGAAQRRRR